MNSMEIARRFAELNEKESAQNAYALALGQEELTPEEELEAASYLFFSEADHRLPFTHFVSLFNRGQFQAEILELMTQAFYLPNVKKQQKLYEKNVKALSAYPYCFRKEFPAFEDLTVLFFPFDDQGFVPFYPAENRFGDYVNFDDPIIDRWFFQDLSKPVLADDVYSQYQLEYLNDNVRKSEWVAKENHIYLHYTNFSVFCAYLQVLNFKKLLNDEKLVFLMEEEISRYPIDFLQEYGIDYSEYTVKPVGIREVNKLIWHTQLASHNGGDFFNEIFYDHPNLVVMESQIFSDIEELVQTYQTALRNGQSKGTAMLRRLAALKHPTEKDILVAIFLHEESLASKPDPQARIAPAIFFQPHFHNLSYDATVVDVEKGSTTLWSAQYEEIAKSPIFKGFKYIKTFTPMRRPTTSYASTVRFAMEWDPSKEGDAVLPDHINMRLLNRSFMVDRWDRLYRDSRLVRFEDGKLNPKATFTALAEFLDIPYTQSMTYCSGKTGLNPESLKGNDLGFSPAAIYRTYDEWANDDERAYLEYFLRDAYETYGYDFHYYQGEPVDEEWVKEKISHFTTLDHLIEESFFLAFRKHTTYGLHGGESEEQIEKLEKIKEKLAKEQAQHILDQINEGRLGYARYLLRGLRFVNRDGQPLQMMTPLKLDPALLEQPLYH